MQTLSVSSQIFFIFICTMVPQNFGVASYLIGAVLLSATLFRLLIPVDIAGHSRWSLENCINNNNFVSAMGNHSGQGSVCQTCRYLQFTDIFSLNLFGDDWFVCAILFLDDFLLHYGSPKF